MKNFRRLLDASDAVATSRALARAIFMMANDLPGDEANAFQAVTGRLIESLQAAGTAVEAVLPKIGDGQ